MRSCLHSELISRCITFKQFQLYHDYNGSLSYYTFLNSHLTSDDKMHIKQMCLQCTCCYRHQKKKHHLYREDTNKQKEHSRNDVCFCSCRHMYRDILRSEEIEQAGSIINHPDYPYIRYVERKREKWIERYFSIELNNNNNKLQLCYKELNKAFNRKQTRSSDYNRQYYDLCKKDVLYYQHKVDRLLTQTSAMYHYFLECNSLEYNIIDIDSDDDYDEMYEWSDDDNESYS